MRSPDPQSLNYAHPGALSQATRRRWLVAAWVIGLASVVPTFAGIALADPAGSRLGVHGIGHLRENFAMLSAWAGLAMATAAMMVFRILRNRDGLGVCTVLAVVESIIALAVSLS